MHIKILWVAVGKIYIFWKHIYHYLFLCFSWKPLKVWGVAYPQVNTACYRLNRKSKTIQVVYSTGITCEVFKDDLPGNHKPVTTSSVQGIRMPLNEVIKKACRNDKACRKIQVVGAIMFNVCFMGSSRQLELFHSITAAERESKKPFGDVQVIAMTPCSSIQFKIISTVPWHIT